MLKSQIESGTEYALREKRMIHGAFQHVRIVEHVRGNKWKAKWIDPNPGLIDYVESGQLIVPWKERKAFLREEENAERLSNHNEREGYKMDSPIDKALHDVFENVGDDVAYNGGVLSGKR